MRTHVDATRLRIVAAAFGLSAALCMFASPPAAAADPMSKPAASSDPKKDESVHPPVKPAPAESRTPEEAAARAADRKDPSGALIIGPPLTSGTAKPAAKP
jgi:hypothetical protein